MFAREYCTLRMCNVVEKAAMNENAARRYGREEADNSMLFGRTKAATLRASCPSGGGEKKRDGALGGRVTRARNCESNLPATTFAPLECQHPTEVRREARRMEGRHRRWRRTAMAERIVTLARHNSTSRSIIVRRSREIRIT